MPVLSISLRIYYNKGFSLNLVERYEEALMAYDRAIQLDPTYAYAYNNKGLTLNNMNKHESAIRYFDYAIKLKPDFLEAVNKKQNNFAIILLFNLMVHIFK